jgi:hypothetical protein
VWSTITGVTGIIYIINKAMSMSVTVLTRRSRSSTGKACEIRQRPSAADV